jgi:dienelactone hydrolase
MKISLAFVLVILLIGVTTAQVKLDSIEYEHGDVMLKGYITYDGLLKSMRPGILLIHESWGITDFIKSRASKLAELGYIVFTLDMYGKSKIETEEEASALAREFIENNILMRERANAGLTVLKSSRKVDPARIAVLGYSFGGKVALELARSGADLTCVVCFHGNLNTNNPDEAKNIKGSVLVFMGANDPSVSMEERFAFQDEMKRAGVDWQFITYGNAVKGFSNNELGFDDSDGIAFNYNADKRSWEVLSSFFREILR